MGSLLDGDVAMREMYIVPAYECDDTGMVLGYRFTDRLASMVSACSRLSYGDAFDRFTDSVDRLYTESGGALGYAVQRAVYLMVESIAVDPADRPKDQVIGIFQTAAAMASSYYGCDYDWAFDWVADVIDACVIDGEGFADAAGFALAVMIEGDF